MHIIIIISKFVAICNIIIVISEIMNCRFILNIYLCICYSLLKDIFCHFLLTSKCDMVFLLTILLDLKALSAVLSIPLHHNRVISHLGFIMQLELQLHHSYTTIKLVGAINAK